MEGQDAKVGDCSKGADGADREFVLAVAAAVAPVEDKVAFRMGVALLWMARASGYGGMCRPVGGCNDYTYASPTFQSFSAPEFIRAVAIRAILAALIAFSSLLIRSWDK